MIKKNYHLNHILLQTLWNATHVTVWYNDILQELQLGKFVVKTLEERATVINLGGDLSTTLPTYLNMDSWTCSECGWQTFSHFGQTCNLREDYEEQHYVIGVPTTKGTNIGLHRSSIFLSSFLEKECTTFFVLVHNSSTLRMCLFVPFVF